MSVKFGLKLWSSNGDVLNNASELIAPGLFHYIELTPVPGTEMAPFKELAIPYIVHATTERWGFNIGDPSIKKNNLAMLNNSQKWADALNSPFLIMHPGFGSPSEAIYFMEELEDTRILIENMPFKGLNGEVMNGSSPEDFQSYPEKLGLCLDINHAVKSAGGHSVPVDEHLKAYAAFRPPVCHIADGHASTAHDEHLHIGDGDYDLRRLLKYLADDVYLTLETPRTSFEDDVQNLVAVKAALKEAGTP